MKKIDNAVNKHRDLILEAERYIWKHPETGYREYKTTKYLGEKFEALGYELTYADGITGFYTVYDTGKPGPTILVLGELDSLIIPNHPESDPETGYVHACGHNAQCAGLLGVAAALKEEGVCDDLCGRIKLCAVPAEELIEIEFRTELKKQGKIKYYGGKGEFLYRGYFDDCDIALLVHTSAQSFARGGHVGCIAKSVSYKGLSAHAGGSPWNGINAVYAATQGLSAANAIRETFQEKDIIRFHPIITEGGAAVNAIPDLVKLESFVRGKTFEAMIGANKKINQALCGAALSIGANIEINDIPGYAPLINGPDLLEIVQEAADAVIPEENFYVEEAFSSGSTDMGDLSSVMPTVHPYAGGSTGKAHGDDYYIADPERACVKSAKMQLGIIKLLLENDATRAKKVIEKFDPPFKSNKEYFDYIDKINSEGDRITYKDGAAEVRL